MIKLSDILRESYDIPGLEVVRDWVVDDYNSQFGYNPDININQLLQKLQPYKKQGKIYRAMSIPKKVEDVKRYIQSKNTGRYASFADFKGGIKYFLPYITQDPTEKPVIISQISDYYSLSDWYVANFDKLDTLYENDPEKYWWIDERLPEVENTGEAIAKLSNNFEILDRL